MNTTASAEAHTKVINLGIAEIWIDRFPNSSARLAITHTAKWEVEFEAGEYIALVALTLPSGGTIKAASIGALVGAAGVFWATASRLL